MGYRFPRIYNLWDKTLTYLAETTVKNIEETIAFQMCKIRVGKNYRAKPADTLREELELIDEVYQNLIVRLFGRQNYNGLL
jgi:peptide chain release factor 3